MKRFASTDTSKMLTTSNHVNLINHILDQWTKLLINYKNNILIVFLIINNSDVSIFYSDSNVH